MEGDREGYTRVKEAVEDLQERLRKAARQHAQEQDRLFADLRSTLAGVRFQEEGASCGGQGLCQPVLDSGASGCDDVFEEPDISPRSKLSSSISKPRARFKFDWTSEGSTKTAAFAMSRSLSKPMPELKLAGLSHVKSRGSLADDLVGRTSSSNSVWFRRMTDYLVSTVRYVESIKEPPRTGRLADFVRGKNFTTACVACIALNALFIAYTTDYEIQHLGTPLPMEMVGIELGFMAFYTMELVLKLMVHRFYFFCNSEMSWNLADCFLVAFSVMDVAVMLATFDSRSGASATVNLSFLRLIRIFKIAKILRIFRTLRFFAELRLMLDCVLGSFVSLFWCLLLLFFVLYVFALVMVQGITQALQQDTGRTLNSGDAAKTEMYFGTVTGAVLTLLQSTTSGVDWREVYVLLEKAGGYLPIVYVFYILFFVIAAWNIVTSTFVDKALRLAQPDLETLTRDQLLKDMVDAQELMTLFSDADLDNSETISLEEFIRVAEHSKFRSYLHVRGIDIKNADIFFEMLRTLGDHRDVELSTLVSTLIRMKGFATSIDLHSLSFETKMMGRKQYAYMADSASRLQNIEDAVSKLVGRTALLTTSL